MANLNPQAIVRDVGSSPNSSRGIHTIIGRITGGGTHVVTVETRLKSIISARVINETDAAVVAPTIADSTASAGTKKVSFSVANTKTYSYEITGLLYRASTTDTTSADTTINYNPLSEK